MCKQCIALDSPGRWREMVKDCTSVTCPLYKVRAGSEYKVKVKRELTDEHKQKMLDGRKTK
jgi:hypothetical protein